MTNQNEAKDGGRNLTVKERLEAKKKTGAKGDSPTVERKYSMLQSTRGLIDALVLAYMIAAFIRTFVFELFMIPTGSMTPTLIGDRAGEVVMRDYDGDGVTDVLYTMLRSGNPDTIQVCLMNADGTMRELLFVAGVDPSAVYRLRTETRARKDMILVNKFSYWFRVPNRGEIAVFKVPDKPHPQNPSNSIFDPYTSTYIKRVVGLPNETVVLQSPETKRLPLGHVDRRGNMFGGTEVVYLPKPILVNGEPLQDHSLAGLVHFPPAEGSSSLLNPGRGDNIQRTSESGVLLIGDNSTSSLDSRYWGEVPLSHLRGQAVLRYLPWNARRVF